VVQLTLVVEVVLVNQELVILLQFKQVPVVQVS